MANLIGHLPSWAQPRVQAYFDEGTSPLAGEKVPIDSTSAREFQDLIVMSQRDAAGADNVEGDQDPRKGFVRGQAAFLDFPFETAYDSNTVATNLAEGAAFSYSRSDENTSDLIVLAREGGADDMVVHLDRQNPENNFKIARV